MVGRIAGRFKHDGVAADQAGAGHAERDGVGEIPGRNHRADAQRDVAQEAAFAGELDDRFGLVEDERLARVKFQEVDGFGGIGFGFVVVLTHFEHQPGVEFELAPAEDFGCSEQHARAFFDGGVLPLGEGGQRRIHRGLDVLDSGLLMNSNHLGRIRRVDDQVVFATQLCTDFGNCFTHAANVLRLAIIGDRLVDERRSGGQSGGRHG